MSLLSAKPANRRIQERLAETLLSPQEAARLMQLGGPGAASLLGRQSERFIAPLTAGLLR